MDGAGYTDRMYKDLKDYLVTEESNTVKVSVIVPCYNVEKYIEECLTSLIKQTFKDIEIICINDGSTDNTPDLLQVFNKLDTRIKVINQKNGGLSCARNTGIDNAKGEYICFLDSDDWISTNFIEKLYDAIKRNDADIAAGTIVRWRKSHQKFRVHYTEERVFESLKDKLEACSIPKCCYVWNKLYKTDLVKNYKFREGVFFEDMLWTPNILKNSGKLVTVPNVCHFYRVNNSSIVKKKPTEKKQQDLYNSKKYIISFFEENNLFLSEKSKMLTKSKKYLLGIPIIKIKEYNNVDTTLLFGFIPVRRSLSKKTFLVFNTACFGDNLVCNALCQNIKRIYPDSKVVFIADKPFADVVRHQKDVDDVVIYDKNGEHKGIRGFFKFLSNFRYKNSYAAIITTRNARNYWLSVLSGAEHVVKGKKLQLNSISAQEQILNQLKYITKEPLINVPIKYETNSELPDNLKKELPKDKKYIALCALTKNPPKDMPIQTAIDIIEKLSQDYKIIFTGVGSDCLNYAELLKSAGCDFIDLVNKTSVYELALVLRQCCGLISVDTGTMHLGYALNIPTIAIFYERITLKCWAPDKDIYPCTNVLFQPSSEDIVNCALNKNFKEVSTCL